MLVTIHEIYLSGLLPEFNAYVDRYCVKHQVTPEIACQHALVIEAYNLYKDKSEEKKGEEENVCRDCNYSDDRSC